MGIIAENVVRAIAGDFRSTYALAREAKIDRAHLSRFLAGKGSISVAALERLIDVLWLDVSMATRMHENDIGTSTEVYAVDVGRWNPPDERRHGDCGTVETSNNPVVRDPIARPKLSPHAMAKLAKG